MNTSINSDTVLGYMATIIKKSKIKLDSYFLSYPEIQKRSKHESPNFKKYIVFPAYDSENYMLTSNTHVCYYNGLEPSRR